MNTALKSNQKHDPHLQFTNLLNTSINCYSIRSNSELNQWFQVILEENL